MDAEFRHTYVNEAALRLTGFKQDELLGRVHWEVFPGALGTEVEANYRRAAQERVSVEFETFHEPWREWYAIKATPAREGGIVIYFRNITAQKGEERAKEQRARQLRRLADISVRINAAHDVRSVVRVVTEEARQLIGSRQAATSVIVSPLHPDTLSVVSTASEPLRIPDEANITGEKF